MNNSKDICPICEEGHLHPRVGSNSVEYQGQRANLDLHFSVCDACGSEQAGATQLRINKRSMVEFRKKVDGLLTGSQVRSIRKNLGLSQAEAARVFGGGPVAFSKYESDDVTQSGAMDKLLRLSSELPSAFKILRRRSGVDSHRYEDHQTKTEVAETDKSVRKGYVVRRDFPEQESIPKQLSKNSNIPSVGSVLGIDVGWSEIEKSSAVCRLFWDSRKIGWDNSRFRAREVERKEIIRSVASENLLLAAAIDGPLMRSFSEIERYRSAERLLSRGELKNRIGKPGQSSSGNGKKLNQQANLSAKVLKDLCEIDSSQEEIRIDPLAIHEAFPTTFLGVMIDSQPPRKKKRSDDYFEYLVGNGKLDDFLTGLLPGRNICNSLCEVRNHDDRAALVCAITALCVTAQSYTAVGDNEDGWIILPPKAWFADWAYSAICNNVIQDEKEGKRGKFLCCQPAGGSA